MGGLIPFQSSSAQSNQMDYTEEYVLFDKEGAKKDKSKFNVHNAINSLSPYAKKVLTEDLQNNEKSVDDLVTVKRTYHYVKRDASGEILPLNQEDIEIIKEKIRKLQTSYEKELTVKDNAVSSVTATGVFDELFGVKQAYAYQQSHYDGIDVTTWATDYASGSGYGVRQKLFGVFNWLWDDDGRTNHEYEPSLDGDDFMTLNWSGDLTLENEKYAEVQVQEYPWNPNTVYNTNAPGQTFIEMADVELNGGLGWRFDEKWWMGGAYYAKADAGHMWVYVHKNNLEGENTNFKFTHTHTWKEAEIGYSISAGYGTAEGGISITYPDKTKNFLTYDNFPM